MVTPKNTMMADDWKLPFGVGYRIPEISQAALAA
jgi:hypothetical protein